MDIHLRPGNTTSVALLFITDAVLGGLPPHIAQVIAGHQDINVTLGYKAVFPDEAVQAHLAFLARRRAMRPTDEYRVPTDEEWTEFLGHFERRKVSVGTCGRSFSMFLRGTPAPLGAREESHPELGGAERRRIAP
ncbi:hypothetical protein ABZ078_12160 [Streptomyces sp. NPDC006385]|uniref:hypothetical protein n=1 Tax=Streptomyces sp. NPDC006385 TaxID=3156761 RepID=UPI0033ACEE92